MSDTSARWEGAHPKEAEGHRQEGSDGALVEVKEEIIIVKCPHCLNGFHDTWTQETVKWPDSGHLLSDETDGSWSVHATKCPTGGRGIMRLLAQRGSMIRKTVLIWPKGVARAPLSPHVDKKYAED
jgi:hypothetical protein